MEDGGWETMGETGGRNVRGTGGRNSESASLSGRVRFNSLTNTDSAPIVY